MVSLAQLGRGQEDPGTRAVVTAGRDRTNCLAVCVDLSISFVCAMFVSNFDVRTIRCLAMEPEKTLAMDVMLVGPDMAAGSKKRPSPSPSG